MQFSSCSRDATVFQKLNSPCKGKILRVPAGLQQYDILRYVNPHEREQLSYHWDDGVMFYHEIELLLLSGIREPQLIKMIFR